MPGNAVFFPTFFAGVALSLWLLSAAPYLAAGWPAYPFDPEQMSFDHLLLIFGLVPRGVVALLAGALLGLSGALLQTVLRNPIADPSSLGISAGAQLALVSATVLAPGWLIWGTWPIAMAGAGGATLLVMAIGAARAFHPVTMVIAGMLVALLASSVAVALTLSQGEYLFSLVIWNGGSLVQTGWGPAGSLAAVLLIGALCAALLARPLGLMTLEASGAQALGLNVAVLRAMAVALAAVLAASVSAAVGLVAFIGVAAPAVARAIGARRSDQLLLYAPLAGALILFLCDGVVLTVTAGRLEMFPTGAATGLIGGPLLLWLLPRLRATVPPPARDILPRASHPRRLLVTLCVTLSIGMIGFVLLGRTPEGWVLLDRASAEMFLPQRLPRLAGAAAAGGLLALAGAMLQRLTANPLAAPEVLGVSGGAAIGYAAVLFTVASPAPLVLTLGAAVGGACALLLLAGVVLRREVRPERVLLAGIAVSALAAAILSVLMAAGTARSFALLAWLSGSATTLTTASAAALFTLLLGVLFVSWMILRWLVILPLRADTARGLGIPLPMAWGAIVVSAGLATGAATLFVGPVSFVGLMAPHLARRLGLARAQDHVAGSVLIGALLMLAADFGARMASFPYDLPLGLFASLLGTPWLLWLMIRRSR